MIGKDFLKNVTNEQKLIARHDLFKLLIIHILGLLFIDYNLYITYLTQIIIYKIYIENLNPLF